MSALEPPLHPRVEREHQPLKKLPKPVSSNSSLRTNATRITVVVRPGTTITQMVRRKTMRMVTVIMDSASDVSSSEHTNNAKDLVKLMSSIYKE